MAWRATRMVRFGPMAGRLALAAMLCSCASLHPEPVTPYALDVPRMRQPNANACLAACAACVSTYWAVTSTPQSVIADLGKPPRGGYAIGDMRDWARDRGFAAYVLAGDLAILREHLAKGRPLIAVLEKKPGRTHAVVVAGVAPDGRLLALMDPAQGRNTVLPFSIFQQQWARARQAILLIASGPSQPGNNEKELGGSTR